MSLIPPAYLDCVVAIGVNTPKGTHWGGTGFFMAIFTERIKGGGDIV